MDEQNRHSISVRKLAILALLNARDRHGRAAQPIAGATRLQKLLFLTDRELAPMSMGRTLRSDINFTPQRFGPADLGVYPDLEFLTALGHVDRSPTNEEPARVGLRSGAQEEATERALSFAYLMGDEDEAGLLAEAEGRIEEFRITDDGRRLLDRIVTGADDQTRTACQKVLSAASHVRERYGHWPLQQLLRYVYSEYPEMTTASEIRRQVLGHD